MVVRASYEFTADEYARGYRQLVKQYFRGRGLGSRLLQVFSSWFLIGYFLFTMFRNSGETASVPTTGPGGLSLSSSLDLILSLIPWFIIFFFIFFVVFLRRLRPSRKAFEESTYFSRTNRVEFTEAGFSTMNEVTSTSTVWHGITRFAETKEFLFLFVAKRQAHIVPKRAFQQPGDLEVAIQLAKSHVGAPLRAFPIVPIAQS